MFNSYFKSRVTLCSLTLLSNNISRGLSESTLYMFNIVALESVPNVSSEKEVRRIKKNTAAIYCRLCHHCSFFSSSLFCFECWTALSQMIIRLRTLTDAFLIIRKFQCFHFSCPREKKSLLLWRLIKLTRGSYFEQESWSAHFLMWSFHSRCWFWWKEILRIFGHLYNFKQFYWKKGSSQFQGAGGRAQRFWGTSSTRTV